MVKKVVAIALFACILLVTLGIPAKTEEPKYGGTLVVALETDPTPLNPLTDNLFETHWVTGNIYDGLVEYDMNMDPQPNLAKSWEFSEGGKKITYHLVDNATWHDGEKFTSQDVKFSIETVREFHPTGIITFGNLESIETPDDYTVIVNFNETFAPLQFSMGEYDLGIIPKHLYEGTDILDNPYNREPIGTGPFKFVEWVYGDHITLEKNPNYWREGLPYLDKIVFKIYPDATARVLALETGDVHLIPAYVPIADVKRLEDSTEIETSVEAQLQRGSIEMVQFNIRNPPLDDKRVRQAIAYAIDKQPWFDMAAFGIGTLSSSVLPPGLTKWHKPGLNPYETNIQKANELLDEAGYPADADGFRFFLEYCTVATKTTRIAYGQIMREQLAEVGIKLNLNFPADYPAAIDKVYMRNDFEVWSGALGSGPDPVPNAARFLTDAGIGPIPFGNCMGFDNSRVNELFELAGAEIDAEKRKAYFWEIQDIVNDEVPLIALWQTYYVSGNTVELVGYPDKAGPQTSTNGYDEFWFSGEVPSDGEELDSSGYLPYVVVALVALAIIIGAVLYYRSRKR